MGIASLSGFSPGSSSYLYQFGVWEWEGTWSVSNWESVGCTTGIVIVGIGSGMGTGMGWDMYYYCTSCMKYEIRLFDGDGDEMTILYEGRKLESKFTSASATNLVNT